VNDTSRQNPGFDASLGPMTRVARYLWERGWAERNGGNLSVDVTDHFPGAAQPAAGQVRPLARPCPALADRCFLVTGSGLRFRDFAQNPYDNACVIRVNHQADHYHIAWGGADDPQFKPTSELPSHLLVHQFLKAHDTGLKVMLHTHPTHILVLSHLARYQDKAALNHALWSMHPEVKIVLPKGVGIVPYLLPGSLKLAEASLTQISLGHRVVMWSRHGALAVSHDVEDAFDLIDTVDKAAGALLSCLATGNEPMGLTDAEVAELVTAFGLED